MIVNLAEFLPGDFTRNADFSLPMERMKRAIVSAAGRDQVSFIDATRLATALMGNSIAANMFMVGYAFQKGALPLAAESIEQAIEMNGEAVAMNQAAFRWGRRAAIDVVDVEKLIPGADSEDDNRRLSQTLDEIVDRRVGFLTEYQDAAYAQRYSDLVAKARTAEGAKAPGRTGLAEAVARNLFKLMAYKDEYEVARLYTDGSFTKQVEAAFEPGSLRFEFHLAPPLLARIDRATGEPRKMSFGPWMMKAFGVLRRLRFLRGTALDPFGYTAERRTERRLIADYEATLSEILGKLNADNHPLAVGLAVIPEKIRGFGHVKLRNLAAAKADEAALLEQFRSGGAPMLKAAE
jgi:indolepyruvate ferredoxin oxidoreductase